MQAYKINELPKNLFKACIASRSIGWLSTINLHGIPNLAPFSYFNIVCDDCNPDKRVLKYLAIVGNATLTMVTSKITMKRPMHNAEKAIFLLFIRVLFFSKGILDNGFSIITFQF